MVDMWGYPSYVEYNSSTWALPFFMAISGLCCLDMSRPAGWGIRAPPAGTAKAVPKYSFPADRETSPSVARTYLPYTATRCRVPSGRVASKRAQQVKAAWGGVERKGRACLALTAVLDLPSRTERQLLSQPTWFASLLLSPARPDVLLRTLNSVTMSSPCTWS